MKITQVEYYTLCCKLPDDYSLPTASFVTGGSIFLKVFTDSDIVGLGEPSPYGAKLNEMVDILKKDLIPSWIGCDPLEINQLTNQISTGTGYGNIGRNALIAGFSQALWDIRGKYENKPLYKLLNPKAHNKIQAYASAGMWYDHTPIDEVVEEALRYYNQGFKYFKLRPETLLSNTNHFQRNLNPPPVNLKRFINLLEKIHTHTNGKLKLMVDAGCRLNFQQASYLCKFMEELKCFFLEEPMPRNYQDYIKLKKITKLCLAGGESLVSKEQFIPWIDSDALDYLQPDSNLAGITEILKIEKAIKNKDKILLLHNWTNDINNLANIHLGAALDTCHMVEANLTLNPLRGNLVDNPIKALKGEFNLTDKPGLGIELNHSILKDYSFDII